MNLSGHDALRALLAIIGPKCSREESARRYAICRSCVNRQTHRITVRGRRVELDFCGSPLTKDPEATPPKCGCVLGRDGRPKAKTRAKGEGCQEWEKAATSQSEEHKAHQ